MDYPTSVDITGKIIDIIGVFSIVFGILFSLTIFIMQCIKNNTNSSYLTIRQNLGKTIIIGLEILIAGDIIRSIAVPPSFTSVAVLGIIVVIRAFLAIQIENGSSFYFPWNKKRE